MAEERNTTPRSSIKSLRSPFLRNRKPDSTMPRDQGKRSSRGLSCVCEKQKLNRFVLTPNDLGRSMLIPKAASQLVYTPGRATDKLTCQVANTRYHVLEPGQKTHSSSTQSSGGLGRVPCIFTVSIGLARSSAAARSASRPNERLFDHCRRIGQ